MPETKDHEPKPMPLAPAKPETGPIYRMLTPEEIEALRQDKKEAAAFFMRRFSKG